MHTFNLANSFDIVRARQCAREMAREMGFGLTDQTRIATAVSELARCILDGSGKGSLRFDVVGNGTRRGLECVCLGGEELGSPTPSSGSMIGRIERLVDDFVIEHSDGPEVAVVIRKWLHRPTTGPAARR